MTLPFEFSRRRKLQETEYGAPGTGRGPEMTSRRAFLSHVAGAAAGGFFAGGDLIFAGLRSQVGAPPGKRRELTIGGRRVKTVDVHAHCFVPEVWDLVKNTSLADA